MRANDMSDVAGEEHVIEFDRTCPEQTLRCRFDFKALTAQFEEI